MRLEAIHAIRCDGVRFKTGSVFEMPNDVRARTLIEKGYAVATSKKLQAMTETREPTEKLLQEAHSGRGRPAARVPKR